MTCPSRLSNVGQRQDFDIRVGASFGPFALTFLNPDGTPLDLTGGTLAGHVRKTPGGAKVADISFSVVDAALGKATMDFTSVASVLTAGASLEDAAGRYVYDVEFADSLGRTHEVLWGQIRTKPEVTHG